MINQNYKPRKQSIPEKDHNMAKRLVSNENIDQNIEVSSPLDICLIVLKYCQTFHLTILIKHDKDVQISEGLIY